MNKSLAFDPCGLEVSARTFIGRRRGPGGHEITPTFANLPKYPKWIVTDRALTNRTISVTPSGHC